MADDNVLEMRPVLDGGELLTIVAKGIYDAEQDYTSNLTEYRQPYSDISRAMQAQYEEMAIGALDALEGHEAGIARYFKRNREAR